MAADDASDLAARVREADLDRYAAARLGDRTVQDRLFALYAAHLEIAAVPWRVSEPQIGAIRLKFMEEQLLAACDGQAPSEPLGEAMDAFAAVCAELRPPPEAIEALIEGRGRELEPEPLESAEALDRFIYATSASLMRLATFFTLGGETDASRVAAEEIGYAQGAARLLSVTKAYAAAGRILLPCPPGELPTALGGEATPGLRAGALGLIGRARARLKNGRELARRARLARAAAPALLSAWRADALLAASETDLFAGPPPISEAAVLAGVLWRGWRRRV